MFVQEPSATFVDRDREPLIQILRLWGMGFRVLRFRESVPTSPHGPQMLHTLHIHRILKTLYGS